MAVARLAPKGFLEDREKCAPASTSVMHASQSMSEHFVVLALP